MPPALDALRARLAELADLSRPRPLAALGPAHDDAARRRARRARTSSRRSSASRTSARPPRRSAGGWTSSTATATARTSSTATSCALARRDWERAAARARRARRRAGAGRAPRARTRWQAARGATTSPRSCPRCGATSSWRAPTPPASPSGEQPLRRAARRLRLRPDAPSACGEVFGALGERAAAARRRGRGAPAPARRWRPASTRSSAAVDARAARASASTRGQLARRRLGAPVHGVGIGPRDTRVTTRYGDGELESVLERDARVRPRALRAPDRRRARAHEPRPRHVDVDPRVPEQAVGEPRRRATRRSPGVLAAELAAGGFAIDAGALHAAIVARARRR